MCTTCGCGETGTHLHTHVDENGNITLHVHGPHDHEHEHDHGHHHHDHRGHEHPEHSHAPGVPAGRAISIEEDILGRNNARAALNRAFLKGRKVLALNLVSSPGSGKTELLTATLVRMKEALPDTEPLVIEGDQETPNDANRIRATGARALQINTGKGCHLDAEMVGAAIEALDPAMGSVLFIENVGNLVCPADFDLGEKHKVVILSVTEGEDKPLKYPDMFRAADLMILNKADLLPYVRFNVETARENALRVNPKLEILTLSASTGEGLEGWLEWLRRELNS